MADTTRTEEFRVSGDKLVGKIKELVNEGNVRRIILKTEDGKTLLDIPLTVGALGLGIGVLLAPFWAAIAAIAAMVARLSIVVERTDPKPDDAVKSDLTETL
jgi:hypothetical protein